MLIPNHQSISKSIESISKNGIDIDAVVRNSLSKLSKSHSQCGYAKPSEELLKRETKPKVQSVSPCDKTRPNKVMPLTPRNKNSSDSNNANKKQSKVSSLRAKIQQQKLAAEGLNKNIKKENRTESNEELDDSLTSLQWLTGVKVNELMEGKPISYAPLSPAPSNCSDEGDEQKFGRGYRYHSDSVVDYRTNSRIKPPYSYAALIIMAMKSKSCSKMTLSEIYKWITDNFVFYKHAEPSWQNSIRHNLSLNKCFAKIPRNKGDPGKGGYWSIVPEYADKLLESNIRKRRSSMMDYGCQEYIKRQRLDLFESQLLLKIKEGLRSPTNENVFLDTNNNNDTNNSKHSDNHNKTLYKNIYKHASSSSTSPLFPQQHATATPADAEQCRMDHPYGKNPFSRFISDEDNIKALADSLQRSSNSFTDPTSTSCSNFDLSSSMLLNTFANAIRTDCSWSAEQNFNHSGNTSDLLSGSMSMVKEELLEARNLTSEGEHSSTLLAKGLTSSLNSSGGFTATFCLSPPLSGDDDTLSDDLDADEAPFNDLDLTIRGTSMTLLNPTPEMMEQLENDIKDEPLSPESIDLQSEELNLPSNVVKVADS